MAMQQYYKNGVAMGLYDPSTESAPGVPLPNLGMPAGASSTPQAQFTSTLQALQKLQGAGMGPAAQQGTAAPSAGVGNNANNSQPFGLGAGSSGGGLQNSPSNNGLIGPNGVMNGGGLLTAASMLGGPVGMAAMGVNVGRKAYNLSDIDQIGQNANLNPMSFAQAAGGMTGLNSYGGGTAGEKNYISHQVDQQMTDPAIQGAMYNGAMYGSNNVSPAGNYSPGGVGSLPTMGAPMSTAGLTGSSGNGGGNGGQSYSGYGGGGGQAGGTSDTGMSGGDFATGGVVTGPPVAARSGPSGLVRSSTPGQADMVARAVPRGSLVVPAAMVSALGQGNSAAGAALLRSTAGGAGRAAPGPAPVPMSMAPPVAAHLSGGEFEITPQHMQAMMQTPQGKAMLGQILQTLQQQQSQQGGQAAPQGAPPPPQGQPMSMAPQPPRPQQPLPMFRGQMP